MFWTVKNHTECLITFECVSKDREQGFPGTATMNVTYEITENNELVISYHAVSDKTTTFNMTNHNYYNLEGQETGVVYNQTMSMNEIAQSIGVSNGALTSHVKKLEETGLIKTDTVHGTHGNQKMCSINIDQITLSFEISSEAPGVCDNWPSDITFRLNDINIGKWTSPGDFGDVRGMFTPDWWFDR